MLVKTVLHKSTNLGDVVRSDGRGGHRFGRRQVPQARLAKKADKMTRITIPHPEKKDNEIATQSLLRGTTYDPCLVTCNYF